MEAKCKKGFTILEALAALVVISVISTLAINSYIKIQKNNYLNKEISYYYEFVENSYLVFNNGAADYIYWLDKYENFKNIQSEPNFKVYEYKDITVKVVDLINNKRLIITKKGCNSFEWFRYY